MFECSCSCSSSYERGDVVSFPDCAAGLKIVAGAGGACFEDGGACFGGDKSLSFELTSTIAGTTCLDELLFVTEEPLRT